MFGLFGPQRQRIPLSFIDRLHKIANTRRNTRTFLWANVLDCLLDCIGRVIGGTIVYHNHFEFFLRIVLVHCIYNGLPDPGLFIKARNNDGYARRIILVCTVCFVEKRKRILCQQKRTGNDTVQIQIFIKLKIHDAFCPHQQNTKAYSKQKKTCRH